MLWPELSTLGRHSTALGLEGQREEAAFWVTQWNVEPRQAGPVWPRAKEEIQPLLGEPPAAERHQAPPSFCPPGSLWCLPLAEFIWKLDDKGAWKNSLQGQDPWDTGPEHPPLPHKRQGIDLRVHRPRTIGCWRWERVSHRLLTPGLEQETNEVWVLLVCYLQSSADPLAVFGQN